MRRLLVLCALASAASCGVPARDNPIDPSNAPHVAVSVSPASGSRTVEFLLDASSSTDPRSGGALRFDWDLQDPNWDAGDPDDFERSTGTDGHLLVSLPLTTEMLCPPPATTCSGVGGVIRNVRVRVTTSSGVRGYGSIAVFLENDAPVAATGGDLFVAPSTTAPVVLDACGEAASCTSRDDDGDPLHYSWEQVGGVAVELTAVDPSDETNRRMQFVPGSASTRPYTFSLTADDGLATSTAQVSVHRAESLWLAARLPGRLYRYFPDFRVVTSFHSGTTEAPIVSSDAIAVDPVSQDIWMSRASTIRHLTRDYSLIRSYPGSGYLASSISAAGVSGAGCAAQASTTLGERFLALPVAGSAIAVPAPGAFSVLPHPAGCYAVTRTAVAVLSTSGSLTPLEDFTNAREADLLADGTLVVADRIADSDSTVSWISPAGVRTDVDLPGRKIDALADRGSGWVWAHDAVDGGFLLVSPAGDVVATGLPDVNLGAFARTKRMFGDPASSAVWFVDSTRMEIGRATQFLDGSFHDDGRLLPEEVAPSNHYVWRSLALDLVSGKLLGSFDGTTDAIVEIPPHLHHLLEVPLEAASPLNVGGDSVRGSVWVTDEDAVVSTGVSRISPAGGIQAFVAGNPSGVAALRDGGAWVGMRVAGPGDFVAHYGPAGEELDRVDLGDRTVYGGMAIDPSERYLCIAAQAADGASFLAGEMLRYDTVADQLTVFPDSIVNVGGHVATATSDGSCVFLDYQGYQTCGIPDRLWRYAPGASVTTAVVTSSGGAGVNCANDIATDPRDGGSWLIDGAILRMVRFDPAGNPAGEIPLPDDVFAQGLAARALCSDAADPACIELFYGSRSPISNTLVRQRGDGVVLDTVTVPVGQPVAIDLVE